MGDFYFFILHMKKSLLLIWLFAVVLAGCESHKISQDQFFEKKQECAKYNQNIKDRIENINYFWNSTSQNRYIHEETVLETFYSPIENTCMFGVRGKERQDGKVCEFYKIYDYFWKEFVEYKSFFVRDDERNCIERDAYNKYNKEIQKLKWK